MLIFLRFELPMLAVDSPVVFLLLSTPILKIYWYLADKPLLAGLMNGIHASSRSTSKYIHITFTKWKPLHSPNIPLNL